MASTERAIKDSSGPRGVYLVLAFCGAFAVSWLAVVAIFFSFKGTESSVASVGSAGVDGAFADAVAITRSGAALSVEHHAMLNPTDSDFMLFVWFKLKAGIDPEERAAFLGKYDSRIGNPEGYALALVGGADGVRPNVYWQNSSGRGRWFAFASTHITPGQWYVMGVTFRAQRYLGVHIAPSGAESNPEVLGGYDLDGAIIPASQAKLSVGAFKQSKFRGHIGPLGVLRDIDISKDASRIMKRLARNPSFSSGLVDDGQIALWATPVEDLGPLHLPISEESTGGRSAKGQ